MNGIRVTRADEGEHWLVATDVTTIKASGRDTSGRLLVMEVTVPPGGGPPVLHRHEYAETFLFQEGEFEVSTLDEDYALAGSGSGPGTRSLYRPWRGTTSRTWARSRAGSSPSTARR